LLFGASRTYEAHRRGEVERTETGPEHQRVNLAFDSIARDDAVFADLGDAIGHDLDVRL
jgi:hypothetical protein